MVEKKKPTGETAPVRKRRSPAKPATASLGEQIAGPDVAVDTPAGTPATLFDTAEASAKAVVPARKSKPEAPSVVPASLSAGERTLPPRAIPAQPGDFYGRAQAATASLRQVVAATTTATTTGALEVNGKVLDALQAQRDAVLDVWRSALAADTLSDAIRLQASGAQAACTQAATHWQEVAETTTRWLSAAFQPIQSAMTSRRP